MQLWVHQLSIDALACTPTAWQVSAPEDAPVVDVFVIVVVVIVVVVIVVLVLVLVLVLA